ncbi:MAG TPA: glucose-6-phosphate isomerase [Dehalococcoidia bacterium]
MQEEIGQRLGWVNLHESMRASLDELSGFAEWVNALGFRHAVVLGMGGSSLAPEVFQRTFGSAPGYPELYVLDTTDPLAILRVENRIDVHATLFIVSSKSGTTLETTSLERYFAERTLDATGDTGALDNFVAVTDPDTPLHHRARESGFHRVFVNPPDVGGRFSALSFFGLVPAAAIGINVEKLLDSAATIDGEDAAALGERLAALAKEGRDKLTFLSAPGLDSFGAWAEQLIAESTGKGGQGIVPIDGEPPGVAKSYGADRVFVSMQLEERDEETAAAADRIEAAGHPVIRIDVPGPYGLGAEFLRWEIATAAAGAKLGLNPFDEPNVAESKDNTNRVIQQYETTGALPNPAPIVEEDGLALAADDSTLARLEGAPERTIGALVAEHFLRSPEGSYLAVTAYIPQTEDHERQLTRLRTALRDATRRATTVGYGPRFLHSTGQLHKGGPATGVFLQLVMNDEIDLDVPGEQSFTFSVLKRAQALGDLAALLGRGRPVVRVSLGDDTAANLRMLVDRVEAALRETAERSH